MQISPEQGAVMQVLAHATRARTAVEVGVFTGYSSTATALALKAMHGAGARLFACDISEAFVGRARADLAGGRGRRRHRAPHRPGGREP